MNSTAKMLFENELINGQRKPEARTYTQDIKDFAFKISFYSNQAYNFLLSKAPGENGLSLPSSRSIRRYLLPIDCQPGHLLKVLDIIKENIAAKKHGKRFSLILDEMSIKEALCVNRTLKSYMGLCFLAGSGGDKQVFAKKCLVFLIVCLDGSGERYIVSYFFTASEAGNVVSPRITECLQLTQERGIEIRCIVFDGLAANLTMVNALGGNISFEKTQNWIPHPSTTLYVVYIFLDACHMLKLVRNLFGDFLEISIVGFDHPAKWQHIVQLHKDQLAIGLRAGNRLTANHLEFHKHEMKVSYAAHFFSRSVAAGIDDGRIEGRPGYEHSEVTAYFLRLIDLLFYFLNTR